MSASFSFGSFGDIITTVQLVWRLAQAISDSHGSAHEFRELVIELNLFHKALDEVLKFWQSRVKSAELDRLADLLKPTVTDCHKAIESFFQNQFERYGGSFSRPKGSRKNISDLFKRIRWNVLEKDKVAKLRDKLRRNKELVDLVHANALGELHTLTNLISIAQEYDRDIVAARLESLARAEAHASDQLNEQFKKVFGYLEAYATVAASIDKNVVAMISEMQITNSRILNVQARVATLPHVHAAIDPYKHSRVLIEDALGHIIPVPLDINPSWETVQSMVKDQFRHRPGQGLVMSKKYILQDLLTGKDLCLKNQFHNIVRPGQRIAMAMVFGGKWLGDNAGGPLTCCPRCGQVQPSGVLDADTICTNSLCKFTFRRVSDMSDATDDVINKWLIQPKIYHYSTTTLTSENDMMQDLSRLITEREITEGPDIFKRVRYISRWEDFEESRGLLDATMNGISFWHFGANEWAIEAGWNITVLAMAELKWQIDAQNIAPLLGQCRWSLTMRFAGYTRETSIPVILVVTGSEHTRQRILTALRTLDFIKNGRIHIAVMVTLRSLPENWSTGVREGLEPLETRPGLIAYHDRVKRVLQERQNISIGTSRT